MEYGLGLVPSPPDTRDYQITDLILEAVETLPPRYLAWNSTTAPVVLNQGNTPHCVAYSTSAVRQFQEYNEKRVRFNFDETWLYKQCKLIDGLPYSDGTYVRAAMKVMKDKGYPTYGKSGTDAAKHRVSAYYAVPANVTDIKRAVKSFGPITVGMKWFRSWLKPLPGGRLPSPDSDIGGHAIDIWGWDDTRGVFYCRNSWGSTWGWNGNFILPYAYVKYIHEAWKAIDFVDVVVPPVVPPTPVTAFRRRVRELYSRTGYSHR